MNEVEKMYSNAGIKKIGSQYANNVSHHLMTYPPFTATKQLELIKWLASRILAIRIGRFKGKYYFGDGNFNSNENNFEEALATRINDLWNILSEEERKQIKEILE